MARKEITSYGLEMAVNDLHELASRGIFAVIRCPDGCRCIFVAVVLCSKHFDHKDSTLYLIAAVSALLCNACSSVRDVFWTGMLE